MAKSTTRQLLDEKLANARSDPFDELVRSRRSSGKSWNTIAIHIGQTTGLWLTGETIRIWAEAEGLNSTPAA